MPALAMNSSLLATSSVSAAEASSPRAIGPRRVKPETPGEDGDWQNGGDGESDWWYYDDWEKDWIAASVGDLRPAGDGNFYRYDGDGNWTLVNNQGDPVNPTPLGATPWLWMLLLVLGYGVFKARKRSWL